MKRHGQFLDNMAAQDRDIEYYRELIGRGRVRALIDTIEDVRRRKEGQRSSSPPIQRGRAGDPSMIRNLVERHPVAYPCGQQEGPSFTFSTPNRWKGQG